MKVYRKNEKMDFIRTDEYATAVFDPDSGCTHLVNDTGTGILDAKAIRQIPRTSDRMWKASSRI